MSIKKRNSPHTKEKIMKSFCFILETKGLKDASVQNIAEHAGVSKVLVYRYFGGVDGMVKYFLQDGSLFPKLSNFDIIMIKEMSSKNLSHIWYLKFKQISENLQDSNGYKTLLNEAIISNSKSSKNIATLLDGEVDAFFKQITPIERADMEAISILLISGLSYLSILEGQDRKFLEKSAPYHQNWNRIDSAIKTIFNSLEEKTYAQNVLSVDKFRQ